MKPSVTVIISGCSILYPLLTAAPQGVCGIHLPGASAGMGLCGAAAEAGSGAVFHNPAATGSTRRLECTSGIGRPFGIPSLASAAVSAGFHGGTWQVCAGWDRIGNDLYIEESLTLACGVQVLPGLCVGGAAETKQVRRVSRDRRLRTAGTIGLLWRVSPGISAGCAVTIASGRDRLDVRPQTMKAGITFGGKGAACRCDYIQRRGEPAQLRAGCEIPLCPFLLLRAGWVHDPPLLTFGIGIRRGSLTLDYSLIAHALLGETHSFSISADAGMAGDTR
ncbi:hypothetical protein JXO52_01040 [bacterium]|nr:hypothetical protein [bacterium]